MLYSVILFGLLKPQLSTTMQQFIAANPSAAANVLSLQSVLLLLGVAVAEELFFRLGIQSYLARKLRLQGGRYWIAIILTALLWALGHTGALDPDRIKLVQILPVGLLLGWLFSKHGTESAILAHGAFNVIMLVLAPYLIR